MPLPKLRTKAGRPGRRTGIYGPPAKRRRAKARGASPPNNLVRASAYRQTTMSFPKTKTVKMRYVDYAEVECTAGVMGGFSIACNSIYDPLVGVGGHQPMGHDEWNLFYNHYRVISSRITAQAVNQVAGIPHLCDIYLSDDNAIPYTNIYALVEAGRGQSAILSGDLSGKATFSGSYSEKQFFSGKDPSNQQAAFGSNPADLAVWRVALQPMDGITTGQKIRVVYAVEYVVQLFEPKDLSQS